MTPDFEKMAREFYGDAYGWWYNWSWAFRHAAEAPKDYV